LEATDNSFSFLVTEAEEPLPARLFKAAQVAIGQIGGSRQRFKLEVGNATSTDTYDDLAFLNESHIVPFPVRLAREAAAAAWLLVSDPLGVIKAIAGGHSVPVEGRRRLGAGAVLGLIVYGAVLSAAYASYRVAHYRASSAETMEHVKVAFLAPLPAPLVRPVAPIKALGGGGGGGQWSVPKQKAEQRKSEIVRQEPRPLDQAQSKPVAAVEVARVAPAAEPAGNSKVAASAVYSGRGEGAGSGHGSGSGSGSGSGAGTSGAEDYNGVFSVGSVSAKPQILGRPAPIYTDEARRAQIEGSVKVSVVLRADGTVSDIRVVRGLGFGLDEKAIEAASHLRFVPAQKDGHQVSVRVVLEFKFSLL
jgi:TonB family protein